METAFDIIARGSKHVEVASRHVCAVFDAPKPRPDLGRGFEVVEAASRMLLDAVAAIRNRVEITACDSQSTDDNDNNNNTIVRC